MSNCYSIYKSFAYQAVLSLLLCTSVLSAQGTSWFSSGPFAAVDANASFSKPTEKTGRFTASSATLEVAAADKGDATPTVESYAFTADSTWLSKPASKKSLVDKIEAVEIENH